jgi:hypothetical protein
LVVIVPYYLFYLGNQALAQEFRVIQTALHKIKGHFTKATSMTLSTKINKLSLTFVLF